MRLYLCSVSEVHPGLACRAQISRNCVGATGVGPHRKNRRKPPTQDGRALRRHRHRWKGERTFAGLGNFRRSILRYERIALV